ncbi:hypothetical protein LCGC14_2734080, partial [marine sediment metagenome]
YSWDNDYMIGWNREEYVFFGDYNATYSFEDEDIGTTDTSIGFVDVVSSYDVEIVGSLAGHKKVIQMTADGGSGNFYDSFDTQTLGSVEFWFYIDELGNNYWEFYLMSGGSPAVWVIFTTAQEIKFRDGAGWDVIDTYIDNKWFHLKIDFDCGTDTYDVYIDGVLKATGFDFQNVQTTLDRWHLGGWTVDSGDYISTDAIDYSWSPGYSNGRNRLTTNDDILGHYPASHSFPFDDVGTNPVDWVVDETGGTVNIISSIGEHRKVLELDDTGDVIHALNIWDDVSSGTIEFWARFTDVTKALYIHISDGAWGSSTTGVNFGMLTGNFAYYTVATGWVNIVAINNDIWYHVKIDFECGADSYKGLSADKFYITVDGVQYGAYNFRNTLNNLNRITLFTDTFNNFISYFDAIDYSWDPYYSTGRNLNPTT